MYTNQEKAREAERELRMRERLFPAWVEAGTLSPDLAARRLALLRAIVDDYRSLQAWEIGCDVMPGTPESEDELRAAVEMAKEMTHMWARAHATAEHRLKRLSERQGSLL